MGQVVHGSSPSLEKDPAGQNAENKTYEKFVLSQEAMINLRHRTCYENIICIPLQLAIFLAPTSGRVVVDSGHGIQVV